MSTGTNRERLEQNNIKLEEIKGKIDKLPEYPDLEPIYGTGDYAVIKITSPNSSYRYICAANGFGDYIAVQFCNLSNFSSSSAKFTDHYLYKIENGAPTLITVLPNTGEGTLSYGYYSVSPFGFYNNKIYYFVFNTNWAEAKTSFFCRTYDLTSGEIVSKTLTYPYRITNVSTVYDDFVVGGGYSAAVCKLDPATDKFTSLGSAPSSGTYLNNDVFVYNTTTSSVLSLWNNYVVTRTKTHSYDSTEYSTKRINGVNIAKDKIFQGKNCYRLNSDLSIGELIKENALLTNGLHYILNDKYMFSGGTLYSYDDKTVTLEPVATFTGGTYKLLPACNSIMYFNSDKTSITLFTFGKTDTVIGITYEDKVLYYGQDKDIKANYLLENREMYDGAGNMVVGTMPNNGELNYTPSTEQQIIPSGYTSGGTVAASLMTQEEYDTCLELTNSILFNTAPYIELEYIESTGTQYIDTGYKAGVNTKIMMSIMTTDTRTTNNVFTQITGAKKSYHNSSAIQVAYKLSDNFVLIDYGTDGTDGALAIPRNTKFNVTVGNNSISVNEQVYSQLGTFSGTCSYPLWIFDCNDAGNHEQYYIGRVYYYKIYENDTLVRDFIPVKNILNNKVCLYDKVENEFYYNAGSGNFIGGGN